MTFGLTGGIGSGKDEAAKILKQFGVKIINADEVGHLLLKKNTPVYKRILKTFGSFILKKNKEIDRKKLGSIVFKNKKLLITLNEIIHPAMQEYFKMEIKKYKASGAKLIILNAAILFEAGWDKLCDKVILISATLNMRIKRLKQRGIKKEKALSIINSQLSDELKRKKSDFIISNNSTLVELKKKIKNFIDRELKRA